MSDTVMVPGVDNERLRRQGREEHNAPDWHRLLAPQAPDIDDDEAEDLEAQAKADEARAKRDAETEARQAEREREKDEKRAARKAAAKAEKEAREKQSVERRERVRRGEKVHDESTDYFLHGGVEGRREWGGPKREALPKPKRAKVARKPRAKPEGRPEGFLSVDEGLAYLSFAGVHRCKSAASKAIAEGRLQVRRNGRRVWVKPEALRAWVADSAEAKHRKRKSE